MKTKFFSTTLVLCLLMLFNNNPVLAFIDNNQYYDLQILKSDLINRKKLVETQQNEINNLIKNYQTKKIDSAKIHQLYYQLDSLMLDLSSIQDEIQAVDKYLTRIN